MKLPASIMILLLFSWSLSAQQGSGSVGSGRWKEHGGITSTAEYGIQRVFTTVGGRLEPKTRTVHKTLQGGLIDEIFVARGDSVTEGQALFSISQNDPGSRYLPVVVESRLDGVVSELLVDQFDEVSSGIPAVVVLDADELILRAVASDLDAFSIRTGVRVNGKSPDGLVFRGILSHVSAEPDYQTGLFTLTFTFPAGEGARIGMPLFIDLPVNEVPGLFVIPDAVVRRYSKSRIWVISDEQTLQSREVETGVVVGNKIQIVTGLNPGETYLNSPSGNEEENMPFKDLPEGGESRSGAG